jgi:hypothetical protein
MSNEIYNRPSAYNMEGTTQTRTAATLTLKQATARLTREYRDRTKRYAKSVHGRGCFSEDNMALTITALENRIEDLGGDLRAIRDSAREGATT